MKKALLITCALATLAMAFTSCVTTHYESQDRGGTLEMQQLAVKDYDIIGPVTVTATSSESSSFLMLHQKKEGSEVVYPMLLDAAIKAGGQDVINVRVSKKLDSVITLGGIFGKEATYTYTATALAIKYNNKNIVSESIVYNNGDVVTTTKNTLMASKSVTPVASGSAGGIKGILAKIKSKLPKLF
ncbi:MAG: DUF6567 family protein [Treponema sp.]|nr:hypothetical protein [Spirochaetia bacterium]MDY2838990.1 DUF6567 family protein [Treponema sp.]MDY5122190.1 DUF6567 family protein [Treponema sp.]